MTLSTITIRGNDYPEPHIDRMKRGQVKKLKPILKRLQGEDLDALWDVVALLVPGLPVKDLDDLDMGECKDVLRTAGVADFDDKAGITAGESSASTSS